MDRLECRNQSFDSKSDYEHNQEARQKTAHTSGRADMSVTNNLFLEYCLTYLKGDNRGREQAHSLNDCLRGSPVERADKRSPAEPRSNHDKYDRGAGEQNGHQSMDCRDKTQDVFHFEVLGQWRKGGSLSPNEPR